ncbi:MAG: uncharacterized protein QG604_624 [Candidatus Dependentiae bacterium]|nr:uncharacterized protein [Candidatus Dependentiae bacterium]
MKQFYLSLLLSLSCISASVLHGVTVAARTAPVALIQAQEYVVSDSLPDEMTVETVFGPLHISEPVLIELFHHPVIARMKEIDQHGPPTYFIGRKTFSRYDHCVGVFALLRMHNRPLDEQVAGLLHDASHTILSHVADHLFKTGNQHAYQDMIHNWYLQKMGVGSLLERHNLTIEAINPDQPTYVALEQKHPRLCADRIQYILNTGLVLKRITKEQMDDILSSLHFADNNWFFSNQKHARLLADISVYCTEHVWSAPEELAWRHWICSALQQAIALDLISSDDIHFGIDTQILEILNNSTDPHIKDMMEKCYHAKNHFTKVVSGAKYDLVDYPKIRAVDPLVKLKGEDTATPLMQRDEEYRAQVEALRTRLSGGVKIKLLTDKVAA